MNFRQFTSWFSLNRCFKWQQAKKDLHHGLGDVQKAHAQTVTYIQWNNMKEEEKKTFYTPVNYTKQSWTCNSHMCQWLCHIVVAQSTVTGPSDWTEREKQSTVTTKKKTIYVHSFKLWNEIFYHKTIELRCAHKYSTKRCSKVSTKTSSQIKQEY